MNQELDKVFEDIQKLVPEVMGIMIASDDGLPMAYKISGRFGIQDPIIISGLISSASAMMNNVLKNFGDEGFHMVFASGDEYSILVGEVEGFYVAFIADANVKLGPLFMEFRKYREKFAEMLRAYK